MLHTPGNLFLQCWPWMNLNEETCQWGIIWPTHTHMGLRRDCCNYMKRASKGRGSICKRWKNINKLYSCLTFKISFIWKVYKSNVCEMKEMICNDCSRKRKNLGWQDYCNKIIKFVEKVTEEREVQGCMKLSYRSCVLDSESDKLH